jgi:hypothetical protein
VTLISAVVIAREATDPAPALASAAQEGVEVVLVAPPGTAAPGARLVSAPAGATPAALRNAGIAAATGRYVCVIEPGESLAAKDVLARQAAALDAETSAIASYGQTLVETPNGAPRARPERGRGGWILRRVVQHKTHVASSACILWRRDMLPAAPYDESYRTPAGMLLALLVTTSRDHPFLFQQLVVAHAAPRREDLASLEEYVKVFVALLYGATKLDERLEARVRFRLARHLVALGKHHYRKGDHARAGRFFGKAVEAVPSYFKGRRYQFMNFLKGVISRG